MGNTNNNPLVSVVVFTYNSEQFVVSTLESVYTQTYFNLELIITDDCSKDNTVDVCRKWVIKHELRFANCVIITSEKNQGIAGNCNQGFRAAKGEWIKSIAGDDVLLPNCISAFVNAALEDNKLIYISYIKEFGERNNLLRPPKSFITDNYKKQLKIMLKKGLNVCVPSLFCSKRIWELLNGFDERYPLFEDTPFFVKCILAGHPIGIVNQELVNYRIHSLSASQSGKYSPSMRKWTSEILLPLLWQKHYYLTWWHIKIHIWKTDNKRPSFFQKYPVAILWVLIDPVLLFLKCKSWIVMTSKKLFRKA